MKVLECSSTAMMFVARPTHFEGMLPADAKMFTFSRLRNISVASTLSIASQAHCLQMGRLEIRDAAAAGPKYLS